MRSISNILISILLLLISSLSCTKTVDVKLPPFQSRLVVHGYIAVGDHFNVTVGRTVRDETFGRDTYLKNALVLLYANDVLADTLRYDSAGQYYTSSKIVAEADKPYTLKVEVAGYQSVEATATGPVLPLFSSLEWERKTRNTSWGTWLDDIRINFWDPTVHNYYMLAAFPGRASSLGCVYSTDPAIEKLQGSVLPFDEGDCIDPETIFFTDKSFNGQLKKFSISTSNSSLDTYREPNGRIWRPYIKFYSISEQFYTYYKYTSTLSRGNDLPVFVEPADVEGNVEGGYGLFTIFSVQTDTLR